MTTTAGRWTKLYGSLIDGDALAMSRDARLLGVEAEAWSDDQETDGRIPRNALRRITDAEDPASLVAELVSTGRWVESDEGWTVVGFLDRHDSADARAAARADDAARIRGWRLHRDGKHNGDGPKSCDRCNAVRNVVTNDVRNEVEATRREATAKRRDATRSGRDGAGSASPASGGSASPALDGKRPRTNGWSDESRAKLSASIKAAHARKRAEKEQRAVEDASRREEQEARHEREQRERDDEWLRLGGSPDALPVSPAVLWRRKNPGRRPLR